MKYLSVLISILLLFGSTCFAEQKSALNCKESCRVSPQIQAFLRGLRAAGNPLDRLNPRSLVQIRNTQKMMAATMVSAIQMNRIVNTQIEAGETKIPVFVYVPSVKSPEDKLPVVLFIHGGGWSIGSTLSYDNIIRKLASAVPAIVISPDYGLAPEKPFPAAVDDCFAALKWAAEHASEFGGDPSKLIVAGDSAGGNLATVTAMKAGLEGPKISVQALIYPSVNIGENVETGSAKCFGRDYFLTNKAMSSFRDFYLPDKKDWDNPFASPLKAKDLAGMPTAIIITAGCDPLLDEGAAYAKRLEQAGTKVIYHMEPNVFHGYVSYLGANPFLTPLADKTLDFVCTSIRENLQ